MVVPQLEKKPTFSWHLLCAELSASALKSPKAEAPSPITFLWLFQRQELSPAPLQPNGEQFSVALMVAGDRLLSASDNSTWQAGEQLCLQDREVRLQDLNLELSASERRLLLAG